MKRQLENEAIEALRQTLGQISVVKIKEIKVESHRHHGDRTIIAHVEIYGHAHRLVCKLVRNCDPLESAARHSWSCESCTRDSPARRRRF